MCLVRHAQRIQNNKFTISLQYHKENQASTRRCDNVGFWLAFGRDIGQRQSNVVTALSFRRRCFNQNLTLLQRRVFEDNFPTTY